MCALLLYHVALFRAARRSYIGRRKKRPQQYEPRVRTNFHIRVSEVRVIDANGQQLGIIQTRDAIKKAQEAELDLVEIAPNERPPVCRIMDFGKYLYEEKKKKQESRKKQVRVEVKECKFRPKIGEHDFQVRVRHAVKFLSQGNKVKLTVMFRGREHAHPEIAERLILRAFEQIKDLGKMEFPPRKEGRDMHTLVAPLPEVIRKKAVKARLALAKEKAGTDQAEDIGKVYKVGIVDDIEVIEEDVLDEEDELEVDVVAVEAVDDEEVEDEELEDEEELVE